MRVKSVLPHPYVQPAGEGKVCGGCKLFRPFEAFSWNTLRRDGKKYRSSRCKECKAAAMRRWYAKVGPQRANASKLVKNYGITLEQYQEMLGLQSGACAICGVTEMPIDPRTQRPYALAVDHDHITGKVRALLCPFCNNGLGCFKENAGVLHAAINYLQKHSN